MIAPRAPRGAPQLVARWPALALARRRHGAASPSQEERESPISPRWLFETKARIGKCITFGMPAALVDEAGGVLRTLASDWRDLVAGSEGYLTDATRAGLSRQRVVWGEQDAMGHVNNVTYVRYAESGRCNWTLNYARHIDPGHAAQWEEMLSSCGVGLILKSITVDYKFPMTWPDRISVFHKLRSRPDESTESLILDVMILSEVRQRPAARCLEDVVVYDYKVGQKSRLEPFMLDRFMETYDLQEETKRANRAKVQQIEDRVRALETQSWDRSDAKEDFGTAQAS